jgi:hypothetical protein
MRNSPLKGMTTSKSRTSPTKFFGAIGRIFGWGSSSSSSRSNQFAFASWDPNTGKSTHGKTKFFGNKRTKTSGITTTGPERIG